MACRVIAFYAAMAQGRKYVSYSRQQAMQKEGEGKEESGEGSKRKRESSSPFNPMNGSFNALNQPQPPREPRPHITPLNTRFQTSFSAQQHSPQASKPINSSSSYISQGTALQTIPRPSLENPTPRQHKPTPILHNQYRSTEHTRFNSSSAFQTSPSSSNPISLFTSSSTKNTTKGNSLLGLAAGLQQQYFKTS